MSSPQEILISPLDQHAPKVYPRMALVFPVTDYEPAIASIQAAINKTCEQIPYLKGKIVEKGPEDRKQSIIKFSPEDPAPQLVEIPPPEGTPSYAALATDRTPFPPTIFPNPLTPETAITGAPVLVGTYTKIDGGLVLCLVRSHKVMDGTGFSELLRIVADNARNSDPNSPPPLRMPAPDELQSRKTRLLGGKPEVADDLLAESFATTKARHPEYTLKSQASKDSSGVVGAPKPGTGTNKVFAFSLKALEAAKAALAGQLPASNLTVNNLLTAIIWSSVTHVRTTRPVNPVSAKTTRMDYSVGARKLVGKSLQDPPYLGNALMYAQAESNVDQVAVIPSVDIADVLIPTLKTIVDAAKDLNAKTVESLVHLSDTNPDLSDLLPTWLLNGPADLHFTSWAQFGSYALDFGEHVGKPQYVRGAFLRFDGVVTMLPRRRVAKGEEEEIEVSILLKDEDMDRLSNDEKWKSWLV